MKRDKKHLLVQFRIYKEEDINLHNQLVNEIKRSKNKNNTILNAFLKGAMSIVGNEDSLWLLESINKQINKSISNNIDKHLKSYQDIIKILQDKKTGACRPW